MDEIKDIVHRVVEKLSGQNRSRTAHIQDAWNKILELRDGRGTRVSGWKNGTLYVCVDSPARLYQLRLIKDKILKQVQKEVPEINSIHFEVGKIK